MESQYKEPSVKRDKWREIYGHFATNPPQSLYTASKQAVGEGEFSGDSQSVTLSVPTVTESIGSYRSEQTWSSTDEFTDSVLSQLDSLVVNEEEQPSPTDEYSCLSDLPTQKAPADEVTAQPSSPVAAQSPEVHVETVKQENNKQSPCSEVGPSKAAPPKRIITPVAIDDNVVNEDLRNFVESLERNLDAQQNSFFDLLVLEETMEPLDTDLLSRHTDIVPVSQMDIASKEDGDTMGKVGSTEHVHHATAAGVVLGQETRPKKNSRTFIATMLMIPIVFLALFFMDQRRTNRPVNHVKQDVMDDQEADLLLESLGDPTNTIPSLLLIRYLVASLNPKPQCYSEHPILCATTPTMSYPEVNDTIALVENDRNDGPLVQNNHPNKNEESMRDSDDNNISGNFVLNIQGSTEITETQTRYNVYIVLVGLFVIGRLSISIGRARRSSRRAYAGKELSARDICMIIRQCKTSLRRNGRRSYDPMAFSGGKFDISSYAQFTKEDLREICHHLGMGNLRIAGVCKLWVIEKLLQRYENVLAGFSREELLNILREVDVEVSAWYRHVSLVKLAIEAAF